MFPRVTTESDDFNYNMRKLLHAINMSGAKPIIVDIVNVSDEVAKRNFNANENIERYNDYLRRLCFAYDCERVRLHYMTKHHPEMLHTDGQHLSKIGHIVLAGLIDDTIEGM
jgi:lysophospholipase L1-like esterase